MATQCTHDSFTSALYKIIRSILYLGVVCMQITATLIFSIFGWILGITELAMASVGLREDLDCYSHCPDSVIYSHSIYF